MNSMGDWADEIPDYAIALARDFWPGPMTLILKRSILVKDFITGGQLTVGLRVPDHVGALALLAAFAQIGGKAIAAPSANRFGHVSPTSAKAVSEELSQYLAPTDLILDGGQSMVGVESTIIDCTGDEPKILRPGAVTSGMISDCTNLNVLDAIGTTIRVSGSLEAHYSPIAKVLLCENPVAGQGFIAFANQETPAGVIRLAAPKTSAEYARTLYSALRSADELGLAEVVAMQPVGIGIEVAIRDRLMRASKGR